MDKQKKTLLIFFVSALAILLVIVFLYKSKGGGGNGGGNEDYEPTSTTLATTILGNRKSKNPVDKHFDAKLKEVEKNLYKMKNDLLSHLQGAGFTGKNEYMSIPNFDVNTLVTCLRNNISSGSSKFFTMDGSTMKEPVLKMYEADPSLFKTLGTCGFLRFLGITLGLTAWSTSKRPKDKKNFKKLLYCLENVPWNDINTWKDIESFSKRCV